MLFIDTCVHASIIEVWMNVTTLTRTCSCWAAYRMRGFSAVLLWGQSYLCSVSYLGITDLWHKSPFCHCQLIRETDSLIRRILFAVKL